ncbi:hypothetical protein KY495_08845 [Massilia sp. PAMC28688]|uniref:DUF6985 domain-containing protein n=1 Tax=Massilia sp. PAMC28688 TaxID=2861283 RepID=UPI001C632051|nr:hypothetical protein [Massilia sp. PAMC28688]QYF95241.1 hypothetical protein KY495_08845 [Massilia sp. PAMC28688]
MFGLFKTNPFHHPVLGTLHRSHGMWRGTMQLAGAPRPVTLALPGSRQAPDPVAVDAACAVPGHLPSWLPHIERALFDHYAPCLDAFRRGDIDESEGDFPLISSPPEVWQHVKIVFVTIAPIDDVTVTELGYETAWDIEHTLGARFDGAAFVELNGSVGEP